MKVAEPTLIINKNQVIQNIKKIQKKAKQSNIRFRPHFKTHQSEDIGEWFRELGVNCITVSSIRMAECFAQNGWLDLERNDLPCPSEHDYKLAFTCYS